MSARARSAAYAGVLVALLAVCALLLVTLCALQPLPERLAVPDAEDHPRVLDRDGQVLGARHDGGWNAVELRSLAQLPPLLIEAVIGAEDRRFYSHAGLDWRARAAALWQWGRHRRAVRGASTLSEQVIKLLHPRPRTLWTRWLEGWEARRLEQRFSKAQILEFYLNQVPYAANRRGVEAAAQYYFDRSVETLTAREQLALAVLLRAPSGLIRAPQRLQLAVDRLALYLTARGIAGAEAAAAGELTIVGSTRRRESARAAHFIRAVLRRPAAHARATLNSSLDAELQVAAERFLYQRLQDLAAYGAVNGAALVVDTDGNRVRAWASVDVEHPETIGIDAVLTPRQPGSSLKPLLYAQAFESGWGVQTQIDDVPLAERVNGGLHEYRNYSRSHYGRVSVAEALGNSLNIPAVKALQRVGSEAFLQRLQRLGVTTLTAHPRVYGDGLALGNAEISLYELVQAYTALARQGRYTPLTVFEDAREAQPEQVVYDAVAARSINGILSDPAARLLEFGPGGVLQFPARTAVKTGTSSDYRDAWTIAYNGQYVVGIWIGNLSGRATQGITGARGPALLARSLLARLTPNRPLPIEDAPPEGIAVAEDARAHAGALRLLQPYDGLQLAFDPRIPADLQAFEFVLAGADDARRIEWIVNDQMQAQTAEPHWRWPLARGSQRVYARIVAADGREQRTGDVVFTVR
ncbi:transglycosylase domain-containing protein [Sinimarinibacterium sp. NLF-5-8]|uniref:transglycosylase domain-containing protein n=1 Tax=Sinimarinibacterium sp. NLF-5-8 TaxID=2698684 RepID=UPI00137C186A|nr:transglycosylase domain-containing protein [Sinimarinibacterium sp. NLF-5-8]QHS09883.1 penicillin-binding protein [Sinimarinibacterium sp. NLF-5-8]